MKKVMLILMMTVGVLSANAQSHNAVDLPPAKERAERQTEFMKEKLELTKDQIPAVQNINYEAAVEMDKVMQLTNRRTKFNAYRNAQLSKDEKLKKVLSKKQFKAYKKSKDEIKKKIKKERNK